MKNLKIFGALISFELKNNYFQFCAFTLVFFLCNNFAISAQELPPVRTFSPKDYQADNQNWSITQDEQKHIYFANNKGLLAFNGATWKLYPSPNQTIIRSVYAQNDRIYSGCYREFGYWEKNDTGLLEYNSLSESVLDMIGADEQFWQIESLDDWIIFQSLDHIYTYNTNTEKITKIETQSTISKMFKLKSDIYYHAPNFGIYKIENGKPTLFSGHEIFRNQLVVNLYEIDGRILAQTDQSGIYSIQAEPKPWPTDEPSLINNLTVYNSIQQESGSLVLGTISQGVIFLNKSGELIHHITQDETLGNNTVLTLFEDKDRNIWLGLDNGINCINVDSPLKIFNDYNGTLGTVYASVVYQNQLFIGTNQGLFYRSINEPQSDFQQVQGSNGQVWTLDVYDDTLFCGHNNGSFIYDDGKLNQISDIQGTWCFKSITNHPNLLLQGNYTGLGVLEKSNDSWQFRNKISGFDISSKFIEFTDDYNLLVDHEYKGVFQVELNEDFTEVISSEQESSVEKGLYSSLTSFNNQIYYAYQDGVWRYEHPENDFVKDTLFSQFYNKENYASGKLISTEGDVGLWSFNQNSIIYSVQSKLNETIKFGSIPIPNDLRSAMVGYENVSALNEHQYLFGFAQGYMIFDFERIDNRKSNYELNINTVSAWEKAEQYEFLSKDQHSELPSEINNIKFNYSIPQYEKYFMPEYKFKLKGFLDEWSPWKSVNETSFNNLPFGEYEFLVKARVGDKYETETLSYKFTIQRPFLLSNIMIFLYALLSILLFVGIHIFYKRFYKKQKLKLQKKAEREIELKDLESQRQLMRFKNEQLKQDIESKNRELAISTMSLIKKNEFLNSIKTELKRADSSNGSTKKVIKIIDKNLNNSDDWKLFEEAFNNADKDFLKKMKSKHPSLTPNDLRLCAYLRLNLSSKEIAPLFNISTKSVEVKRYRLRKKMDLPREIGLTDYILEI